MNDRLPGRPIEGTTARFVPAHLPCHNLDHDVTVRAVHECFLTNIGPGFYGLAVFSNGSAIFAGETPNTPPPPAEVMDYMLRMGREVNAELHAHGHWLVAWHAEQRLALLWRTGQGLCKMTIGFDQPWPRMRKNTMQDILETAAAAMVKAGDVISGGGMEELYQKLVASRGSHGSFTLH